MSTQIIIDSTADMPPEWKEKYKIETLPIELILDGHAYKDDGKEITLPQLYSYMESGKVPKTSQPIASDIRKFFENNLKEGKDVLYLAFSDKLSGTMKSAQRVAEELMEQYPDRRIEVVDSKGGAFAVGLIAAKLSEMESEGADLDTLVEEAKKEVESTHYLFTLTNLDWLAKGGRISKTAGYVGDFLNIKPILTVNDGNLEVIKKVRGDKKADKYIIDHLLKGVENNPKQRYGIGHSNDLERAQALAEQIKEAIPGAEVTISEIGAVLTTHLGIGGIGVFWLDDNYFDEENADA